MWPFISFPFRVLVSKKNTGKCIYTQWYSGMFNVVIKFKKIIPNYSRTKKNTLPLSLQCHCLRNIIIKCIYQPRDDIFFFFFSNLFYRFEVIGLIFNGIVLCIYGFLKNIYLAIKFTIFLVFH